MADHWDAFEHSWQRTLDACAPLMQRMALRGLRTSAIASQETMCYSGTLLLDGMAVAKVWNDGHGGETMVEWASAAVADATTEAMQRLIAAAKGDTVEMRFDTLVDELAAKAASQQRRDRVVKRWHKQGLTALVFRSGNMVGCHPGRVDAELGKAIAKGEKLVQCLPAGGAL